MKLQELEAAVTARPHSPLFARLASEYLALGRSTEARELCLRGLELYPDYLAARLVLARCLHLENHTSEALGHLAAILSFFPDAENVLRLKADWEQTLIEPVPEQAENRESPVPQYVEPPAPVVEEAEDDEMERRIVSKTLAEIYAQQGAIEEAILTYRLLRRARPDREREWSQRIVELEAMLGGKIPANPPGNPPAITPAVPIVQPELRIQ